MNDLVAFLAARLDEREAMARAFDVPKWAVYPAGDFSFTVMPVPGTVGQEPIADAWSAVAANWIVSHDPAHMLRDIVAARALIADYELAAQGDRPHDRVVASVLILQIAARADIWSDDPGYREEWKP